MATNEVFALPEKLSVVCSHPAVPVSGEPVRYGQMSGVAVTDERADGTTTVDFGMRVWDLSVDDDGGGGIAVGDPVYFHDAATGVPASHLNNVAAAMDAYFGIALEVVAGNATTVINVLHIPVGASIAIANGAVVTAMIAAAAVTSAKMEEALLRYADLTLTSAQVKALKATPKTIVAAPGADKALVPIAINLIMNYGGTNVFTEAADDLSIGWAAGAEIMEIEATGFIDQANDEWRYITFECAETFIPSENTAIVITNLDDEYAGNAAGDNTLTVRLWYRVVPNDV